ncbi:MAG: hypothetical protein Q8K75_05600 [Chlamydiales bacterium]|nr:hypothetical protein [Chlamydiales bacterium]
MTAFLRDDLWAKPYIYRAEEYAATDDKDSVVKLKTRATFGVAAVVGTAQTVMYAVPAVFLLIGHVAGKVISFAYDFKLCHQVSNQYHEFSGKLWGSVVATAIATASATTSTELSQKAQGWLLKWYAGDWNEFKTTQLKLLTDRIDNVKASKIASTIEEERYVTGSTLYFDSLASEMTTKVEKMINQATAKIERRGLTEAQKYELMRQSMQKISRLVEKSRREAGKLPMTYLELSEHKVTEAIKLKNKAVKFLDKQANRVLGIQVLRNPTKFDTQQYSEKVGKYREDVTKDFDTKILKLIEHAKAVNDAWGANVDPAKNAEKNIERTLNSYKWWANWFGGWAFSDTKVAAYDKAIQALETRQQQARGDRVRLIQGVRQSVFKDLEWNHLQYQRSFCDYVGPRGWTEGNWVMGGAKIIRQLEWFGKPSVTSRWYRSWVKPVLGAAKPDETGWRKTWEDLFDPDAGTFDPNEWRVSQWLDKHFGAA